MLKQKLDSFDRAYKTLKKKENKIFLIRKSQGESLNLRELEKEYENEMKHCLKMEIEARKLLDSLPSGKGKDAAILHYLAGKTYAKRAKELRMSERQLMRLVQKTLSSMYE